ncbi:hypothetical protein N9955_00885 [bacterium]|nr:hypothetical protein [bacterium]
MFYKIQPEQIKIHDFSSPSGDMRFESGANYVYANLSRFLTGDFQIDGTLSLSGHSIPIIDSTNSNTGVNSFVYGGLNNDVNGDNGIIVNGNANTVNGDWNAVFNGSNSTFEGSTSNNTVLAGAYGLFESGTQGATIIGDTKVAVKTSRGSHSLSISFDSGVYFEAGVTRFDGTDTYVNTNFYLESANSGIFSGGCNFLSTVLKNGDPMISNSGLVAASGALTGRDYIISGDISDRMNSTGQALISYSDSTLSSASGSLNTKLGIISGNLDTVAGDLTALDSSVVKIGGAQSVAGTKTFSSLKLNPSVVPTGNTDAAGSAGMLSYESGVFYIKTSDSPDRWMAFNGTTSW